MIVILLLILLAVLILVSAMNWVKSRERHPYYTEISTDVCYKYIGRGFTTHSGKYHILRSTEDTKYILLTNKEFNSLFKQ